MNLVFLLKNELVLPNQRHKVSFVFCCLIVDLWRGPWEQGVSVGAGGREPLLSRACVCVGVPGTFPCGLGRGWGRLRVIRGILGSLRWLLTRATSKKARGPARVLFFGGFLHLLSGE